MQEYCLEELGGCLPSRLVTSSRSRTSMATLPDSGARLGSWMKLRGLTVSFRQSRQPQTDFYIQESLHLSSSHVTASTTSSHPTLHSLVRSSKASSPSNSSSRSQSYNASQHSYSHSANSRDPEIRRSVQPHTAGLTLLCI